MRFSILVSFVLSLLLYCWTAQAYLQPLTQSQRFCRLSGIITFETEEPPKIIFATQECQAAKGEPFVDAQPLPIDIDNEGRFPLPHKGLVVVVRDGTALLSVRGKLRSMKKLEDGVFSFAQYLRR
ncbi:MAG: hypothetical protein OEY44_04755 [Candidatus Peregrinibacteria bacterium]|nr:hypothetical protein [Candidatus Peregrinibacteria bacterium]